jgi:hypothetical protein
MMKKRVLEIACSEKPYEIDARWANIRRGWYFGGEEFRGELLEKLDDVIGGGKKRESFSGESTKLHDESEAIRLLDKGLRLLGINADALEGMRKNAPEKQALAWYLRARTIVSNQWLTEHLYCGHSCNVSAFVGNVKRSSTGDLASLRKTLISKD